jgi:hypothetical protein
MVPVVHQNYIARLAIPQERGLQMLKRKKEAGIIPANCKSDPRRCACTVGGTRGLFV